MAVIIVTGTPGTGKTELAKALAKKLGYEYVDVNDVIDEADIIEEYDEGKQTNVVNEEKLSEELVKLIKKGGDLVIDSHMSQCIPAEYVDRCIVTKCDLKVLKKRLEGKGYHEEKVRDNLDSEIFDICLNEAEEGGHKLIIVDTSSKKPEDIVESIMR